MSQPGNSRLASLSLEAVGDQRESLVLSLQAIFRAYGRDLDYDELAAVTANSLMTTWTPDAPDPTWWPVCGRHAFLESAARTYGLALRELHPPDAAPRPPAPPEYELHFRDSYLPFIQAALERDEPVLAWAGWPAPHEMLWVVITGVDAASRQCTGCSCASPGQRVLLTGPPVQVYLVQDYTETCLTPGQVLSAALQRADAVFNNRLAASFGVVSGPAALEKWHDALATDPGAPGLDPAVGPAPNDLDQTRGPGDFHPCLARFLVCGRRSAIRFFERFRPHADAAQQSTMDTCLTLFRKVVTCMEPACDADYASSRLKTDSGRGELSDALAQAIDLERRAAGVLSALLSR
ncbi:MAG: hypothetical protein V3S01_00205 [Dehalococcoidia bacterium]